MQSPEAMIDRVADDHTDDHRLLVVEPEYWRLVETMARTGTLSAQLRNAWDGQRLQRIVKERKRSQTATHAHISMLGMITSSDLLRHHTRLRRAGGLESRLLYCYSVKTREVSPWESGTSAGPELSGRIRDALARCRRLTMDRADPVSRHLLLQRGIWPSTVMPVAEEVQSQWAEVKRSLPVLAPDYEMFAARGEVHVVRLALTYAMADSSPVITMSHVRAAVALWTYCARSAEVVFSVPVGMTPPRINPAHTAKAFQYLHSQYPAWISVTDLNAAVFKRNVPAADREAILEDLIEKDLLEQRTTGTKGRPRHEIRLLLKARTT